MCIDMWKAEKTKGENQKTNYAIGIAHLTERLEAISPQSPAVSPCIYTHTHTHLHTSYCKPFACSIFKLRMPVKGEVVG